jgi:hypothetical protein
MLKEETRHLSPDTRYPIPNPQPLSPIPYLLCLILSGTVIGAFLLDLVGLPVRLWSVAVIILVMIAGYGFWFYHQRLSSNHIQKLVSLVYRLRSFLSFILHPSSFILLGVFAYLLWLGRPSLLPVGTTVDAVHQYGLAQYINESGRLPIHALEQKPNLQDGLQYPPAFVICAALLSQLLNLDVVYLLYPLASLFLALAVLLVFAIVSLLLEGKSGQSVLAAGAAGLSLVPYGYTFGSITDQNYFAQVMGQMLILLSLYFLLFWQKNPSIINTLFFNLTLVTLLITYPTWAFISFAAFVLVATGGVKIKIKLRFGYIGVTTLVFGVFALLFLKDRIGEGLGTVANEGLVLLPDLANYTYPLIILAGLGLILVLWKGDNLQKAAALFCGVIFAEGFGFWILKTWFEIGSYYSIYKLLYLGAFFLPILAALGLHHLFNFVNYKPKDWLNWLAVPVFGLFLAAIWLIYPKAQIGYRVITPDNVSVAQWMAQNLKVGEYSIAYALPYGTPAYWVQIGFLEQPRGVRSNNLITNEPISFPQWFYNPDSEQYLFTDDLSKINLDERLQVLYQSGNSAVLTRTAAYKTSQQSGNRPNLNIAYKVTLEGSRLNINSTITASEEPRKWFSLLMVVENSKTGATVLAESSRIEEGRERQQFLGLVVNMPTMQVQEFYLNNQFPVPKNGTALTPGKYSVYLGLQKGVTPMEQRKVLEFEFDGTNFTSAEPVVLGQFIFEGALLEQSLPNKANQTFELNTEKLTLESYNLPETVKVAETVQIGMNWRIEARINNNYRILLALRDAEGKIVSETEYLPRNGLYPTWLWTPQRLVNLAPSIKMPGKSGKYSVAITLLDPTANGKRSQTFILDKIIEVR